MTAPLPPVNIPGAYTLSVLWDHGGQPSVSVLGIKNGSSGLVTRAQGIQVLQAFMDAFRPSINLSVACTGAVLRQLVPNGVVEELPPPTAPAGTGTGGVALPSQSYLIKWATGRGGRTGKGRTYLPGIASGVLTVDGRSIIASVRDSVSTQCATYIANTVFLDTLSPAVVSRKALVASDIISGVCSTIPGQQRRRMR